MIWLHLLEWVEEVRGMVGGGAGVAGDPVGLLGVAGIAAGVLVGDPGEQFGLAGEELGPLGVVVASGAATGFGEVMEELGDVAGGDRVVCAAVVVDLVVVGHGVVLSRSAVGWDLARLRWLARSR